MLASTISMRWKKRIPDSKVGEERIGEVEQQGRKMF